MEKDKRQKMAKSTRKRTKRTISTKKTTKDQAKAGEYLDRLLELHKLQSVLLAQLRKEV